MDQLDDLLAKLEELNALLAATEGDLNASARISQEIETLQAEIGRRVDEETRRFGGA